MWEDPFLLSRRFSEEETLIWDSAKDYAKTALLPRIVKAYNEETVDLKIMKEMGQRGFLGCTQTEYGLPGVSQVAYGLINREIEAVDSAYRSALSVQNGLVIYPIISYGTKSIKDKYIPKLASGDYIGCFGLTEPNHGSNPSGMDTHSKKIGHKYLISGSKT